MKIRSSTRFLITKHPTLRQGSAAPGCGEPAPIRYPGDPSAEPIPNRPGHDRSPRGPGKSGHGCARAWGRRGLAG
jgi:hypothetical protein